MVLCGFACKMGVGRSSKRTGVSTSKFPKHASVLIMEFLKNTSISSIGKLTINVSVLVKKRSRKYSASSVNWIQRNGRLSKDTVRSLIKITRGINELIKVSYLQLTSGSGVLLKIFFIKIQELIKICLRASITSFKTFIWYKSNVRSCLHPQGEKTYHLGCLK